MVLFNLRHRLTLLEVAQHLGGCDPRVAQTALVERGYATKRHCSDRHRHEITWLEVFRLIHRIEPTKHEDILSEIAETLLTSTEVAGIIGLTPDAMRKARSRGRLLLPGSVRISPRIELWRPRDIRSWTQGRQPTRYCKPAPIRAPDLAQSANANPVTEGLFSAFLGKAANTHHPDTEHTRRTASALRGKYT